MIRHRNLLCASGGNCTIRRFNIFIYSYNRETWVTVTVRNSGYPLSAFFFVSGDGSDSFLLNYYLLVCQPYILSTL